MLRSYLLALFGMVFFLTPILGDNCPVIAGFSKMGDLDGHGYYLSENKITWEEANLLSQELGGYLVSISTQDENEFVREHLGNDMVFIGLNDKNQEGNPQWSNGETISLNWSSNNNDNNDFAVMNFWNGHWQFGNKWEQRKFVMEMDCGQSPPTQSSPVQVFIFAGQSNMSGGGMSNELDPSLKIVPANATLHIHFYGYDYTDFSAGNFGPEIEFIHEITNANPTQKFLFIKYAWGGTGMNQWMPGTTHYQTLKNKIYQALGGLNSDYELSGFLWMQGETDAFSPYDSGLYGQRFTTMITSLRNELGDSDIPVLIGQIDPPNSCCAATVRAAEEEFVENDAYSRLVLTGGLSRHWSDPIHYNTAGQIDLGHRFFASYQSLPHSDFELHCPDNINKVLEEGDHKVQVSWAMDDFTSNCDLGSDVDVSQIFGMASGSEFEKGHYDVTYAAMDECQNKDTCSFTIDVSAFSPCPSTINGFKKLGNYNGHSYFLSETKETWLEAHEMAAEQGGYLATLSSQEENDFLQGQLNQQMVFIGLNDQMGEGQLTWTNGETVSLDLSYENNENNDFAVMNFWAGTWQMVNKWVAKPYVLELDCADVSTRLHENDFITSNQIPSEISPNPVHSYLRVPMESATNQDILLEIFSIYGERFLAEKRTVSAGTSIQELDVKRLPNGVYFVRMPLGRVARFVKD